MIHLFEDGGENLRDDAKIRVKINIDCDFARLQESVNNGIAISRIPGLFFNRAIVVV